MRNRVGRLEAFDVLLEELTNAVLESRAAAPAAGDLRPEARYAGARTARGLDDSGEVQRTIPSLPRATGRESTLGY